MNPIFNDFTFAFEVNKFYAPVLNILYHDVISNLWWFAVPNEICYNMFHFLNYSARDIDYTRQV